MSCCHSLLSHGIYETVVFKILKTKQRKIVIPERWETKKVYFIISPAYRLFLVIVEWRRIRIGIRWALKLKVQSELSRETKQSLENRILERGELDREEHWKSADCPTPVIHSADHTYMWGNYLMPKQGERYHLKRMRDQSALKARDSTCFPKTERQGYN